MKRLAIVAFLAASPALAEVPRAVQPTRDVDITYKVPIPGAGNTVILQRLRWSAATTRQRLDMPTSGLWIVLDFAAHRMSIIRDDTRQVVDRPAPPSAAEQAAGLGFSRQGTARVADLPCTLWRSTDAHGLQTLACYTDDGILLRATAGPRLLMEAISVAYAPQNAAVFQPPGSYTHSQAAP